MKILLVEDDSKLSHLIKSHLEKYGYEVFVPTEFKNLLDCFKSVAPDLILMDVNLPVFDGFYWTKQLRQLTKCPIIFLSARDSQMDQVLALEYGGDDYIVKPFSYDLLLAKVKSHLRRAYGEYAVVKEESSLTVKELTYFPDRLEMVVNEKQETLSLKEGQLLKVLMSNYPDVVSRQELLGEIWDDESFVDDNTLSVNMTRLRKKLAQMDLEESVLTVRGKGYRLVI